jgi:hypothetical protein
MRQQERNKSLLTYNKNKKIKKVMKNNKMKIIKDRIYGRKRKWKRKTKSKNSF